MTPSWCTVAWADRAYYRRRSPCVKRFPTYPGFASCRVASARSTHCSSRFRKPGPTVSSRQKPGGPGTYRGCTAMNPASWKTGGCSRPRAVATRVRQGFPKEDLRSGRFLPVPYGDRVLMVPPTGQGSRRLVAAVDGPRIIAPLLKTVDSQRQSGLQKANSSKSRRSADGSDKDTTWKECSGKPPLVARPPA